MSGRTLKAEVWRVACELPASPFESTVDSPAISTSIDSFAFALEVDGWALRVMVSAIRTGGRR